MRLFISGLVYDKGRSGISEYLRSMTRALAGNNDVTIALLKSDRANFPAHIKGLKKVYHNRIQIFCHELRMHLPDQLQFKTPDGGYFVWVKFPKDIDTNAFRKPARKQNVDFHPGSLFSHKKELQNYMRLSFAFYEEEALIKGARRLGRVIREHI